MDQEEKLLTPKELMDQLKISESLYAKLRNAGNLPPHIIVGSRLRFPKSKLNDWINNNLSKA